MAAQLLKNVHFSMKHIFVSASRAAGGRHHVMLLHNQFDLSMQHKTPEVGPMFVH